MHGALSAAAMTHAGLKEWSQRLELTIQQDREEEVLFDRELFYAMQTRERLTTLIGDVRVRFGGVGQSRG